MLEFMLNTTHELLLVLHLRPRCYRLARLRRNKKRRENRRVVQRQRCQGAIGVDGKIWIDPIERSGRGREPECIVGILLITERTDRHIERNCIAVASKVS